MNIRKLLLLFFMVLFFSLWSERVEVSCIEQSSIINYEQSDRGSIRLDFCLDGYDSKTIERSGDQYTQISYNGEGKMLESGMPDVPVFTRLVAIADAGEVTYNIISANYEVFDNVIIYPQSELSTDQDEFTDTFTLNENYYKSGGLYPAESVIIGEPVIMRDLRLVKVTFCPFRYFAKEKQLYVYHNISVEIITSGEEGLNCKTNSHKQSRAFNNIYKSSVLNYAEVECLRDEFQRPSLLIIYPDNETVAENLSYLVDWKEKKGFEVNLASTAETGSTNILIKNYIQNAYDNWENPPEYIILVGDASGGIAIPPWYETYSGFGGIGDLTYTTLAGDDILADVMLGRFSVDNSSQLQTMIAKAINYERVPYTSSEEWFQRACLITSGGESKQATCEAVQTYIENYNPDFIFEEHYTDYQPYVINDALNIGVSYLCARCGGGMGGWGEAYINSLTNGWMLPFASVITCYTGDFGDDCITELFTKAGTPTNPKGGIAAIGSATGQTSTCINNCITAGIFYGIFAEQIFNPGGALLRGKLNLYQQYPQNPNNQVNAASHWNNLMGDPSIELWTSVPEPMTVFYEEEVASGTNWMEIHVIDSINGMPLADAWVAARGSDYYQTGYTDYNGVYYLDLQDTELSETYELTITCHDKLPFEETFSIIEADINLTIDQLVYSDNGDGIPNPGETINLDLNIANHGTTTATGITAMLTSHCDFVQITNTNTDLSDISAGESIDNSDLALEIDPDAYDGITAMLELELSSGGESWTTPVFMDISGGLLYINNCQAIDANGIVDPGEVRDIFFCVENMGELPLNAVTGELNCLNHRITIMDSIGDFGTILPGEEVNNNLDVFTIFASSTILPGTQIPMSIHFTNEDGYDSEVIYLLEIGEVTQSDPLGADAYGYYCYDDGDTDYIDCPEYDWIEINQTGEELPINSWGSSASITDIQLPDEFTFVYYGVEYDLITVATAGWICPGGTEVASFMNWMVPGAQGPSPIIAAFWDDLTTQGGGVFTYFDETSHYYVIEWYNMNNYFNNAEETFQLILYDSEYYPTLTGDSNMKMQYQVFNNVDVGYYYYHDAAHGQYCTVGLEDPSGLVGLQYTFNNEYPNAAKPLENCSALYFTCQPVIEGYPCLRIADYSVLAGDDEYIESGEEVSINLIIENIGDISANSVEINIIENDEYIEITDASEYIEFVEADGMIELSDAFNISVSENVPDFYNFVLNVTIESEEDSWEQLMSFTAYYPNIFDVNVDSIGVDLIWGEQTSRDFTLSNTGNIPANYYIRIDELMIPERDVSGSYITCGTDSFTPGEETVWTFSVFNGSQDNEWISDVWLDFPIGVDVQSASNVTGGSGGDMIWDGTSGAGQRINWHGMTANDWGVLQSYETAEWEVHVILSSEFAGDMTLGWELSGDTYGEEPHTATGDIMLLYPLRWINLNTSAGLLGSGDEQEILVNFDTSDVEETAHACRIVITSDSWDSKTIPVVLTPIQNDNEEIELVSDAIVLQNYPNPFNPETTFSFKLSEPGKVKLEIFNFKGQKVKILYNDWGTGDEQNIVWRGDDEENKPVSSGIYFGKLSYKGDEYYRKCVLLK